MNVKTQISINVKRYVKIQKEITRACAPRVIMEMEEQMVQVVLPINLEDHL